MWGAEVHSIRLVGRKSYSMACHKRQIFSFPPKRSTEVIRFVDAVQTEMAREKWYSALLLAFRLPEICLSLSDPSGHDHQRYSEWWARYVQSKYTVAAGANDKHVLLTGRDVYALRCAYLHDIGPLVSPRRAREVLNAFYFIEPPESGCVHKVRFGHALQMQIDMFCKDVCDGVLRWESEVAADKLVRDRKSTLLCSGYFGDDLSPRRLVQTSVYALPLNRALH